MNYLESLKETAQKNNSIVCMGMDPVIENIPLSDAPHQAIRIFYEEILNKMKQRNVFPASVKPNYAFYAQYGLGGIETLQNLIALYREEGIPVILDVKRGDIGKTAAAYAAEAFDFFKADAVTLAPYMGTDSIYPFIDHSPDKGYYILTRTSNKSSVEIQDAAVENNPLFLYVADKIVQWYRPGMGSVVGATFPEELARILNTFNQSEYEIPLLIPGIGSQGGDLKSVIDALKGGGDYRIHRINSSSAINYAYKKKQTPFDEAAVEALEELNEEINTLLT